MFRKFTYKQIDFDKLDTGHIGVNYSHEDWVSHLEIGVERIEANNIGYPKENPIATHVWGVLKPKEDKVIERTHGLWFLKKTEKLTISKNVAYVFEETATGFECTIAKDKYGDKENFEILTRIDPLTEAEKQTMEDLIIQGWKDSVAYGWLNFPDQLLHVCLRKDITTYYRGSEICSGIYARTVNTLRELANQAIDFVSRSNTNPFEWSISNIWVPDENVIIKV